MATLGDLRAFASEIASHDLAGATANREITFWINSAIQRVWRDHEWSFAKTQGRINLVPGESGTTMVLTQGSGAISVLAPDSIAQKYLDDRWHLHVDAQARMTFELSAIASGNLSATMRSGHIWIDPSTSGEAFSWRRHIYDLPDNAKTIELVIDLQSALPLIRLAHQEFDDYRQWSPTQATAQPTHYTVRGGKMEVWPAPDTDYRPLNVTYKKGPTTYTTSDVSTTDVGTAWPAEWDDLLYAAITQEAAEKQGKNSPVLYSVARNNYLEVLRSYQAEDSGIDDLGGPMSLGRPTRFDSFSGYQTTLPIIDA